MLSWDKALRRYELLDLLSDACNEFGPACQSTRRMNQLRLEASMAHGSVERAKDDPVWKARLDRAWREGEDVEQLQSTRYLQPAEKAAVELIVIPAPTLDAVRIKVAVISKRELWSLRDVPGDCFELIEADVRRLLEADP